MRDQAEMRPVSEFLHGWHRCFFDSVCWPTGMWFGLIQFQLSPQLLFFGPDQTKNKKITVKTERGSVDVVFCLERGADCLHMVQLMPLPSRHLLSHLNPDWFYLSGTAHLGCPGTEAVK